MMPEATNSGGQYGPWCAHNWPVRTTRRHLPRPLGYAGLAAMHRVCRQCRDSPPLQSIGTYLASALIFTAQNTVLVTEIEMQTDPILLISLIRQSNASPATADVLLQWLKQASLLCAQSHGDACSRRLVQRLTAEFDPILQTLAGLGGDQAQQLACQQLFSQVCQFYRSLNHHSETRGLAQQVMTESAGCRAKPDAKQEGATAQAVTAHALPYNRYD